MANSLLDNLIDKTVSEFDRAAALIEGLDDESFMIGSERSGSIGAHFRHNYEIAKLFLAGLGSGNIDFARRDRDVEFERNRQYAISKIRELIMELRGLTPALLDMQIKVRSEIDENIWHDSSAMRELEFVHSHTVHHHALISEKLRSMGHDVSFDFGVAPSTLKFWEERRDIRKAGGVA